MGLFRKKPDPVSERARDLDDKIAALQAEIKKLSHPAPPTAPAPPTKAPAGSAHGHSSLRPDPPSAIPKFTTPEKSSPRLRSTARPQRPLAVNAGTSDHEPVFEEVNQPPIKADDELRAPVPEELGTRKSDLSSWWKRLIRNFRGPVTSNPKLVNYLAAGSIQGLQPLRYEKRVARNRLLFFALCLLGLVWGLIVMLIRRY